MTKIIERTLNIYIVADHENVKKYLTSIYTCDILIKK